MKLGFPRAIISCCILLILLSAYAYAQSSAAPELPGQQDIPIPQLPGATDSSDQSGLPDLSALTNDSGVSEPQRLPYEARWELFRLGDTAGSLLAILWMTPDQGIHAYAHRPGSAMAKPTSLKVAVTPDSVLASVAYPAGVLKKDPLFPEGSVNLYPETTPLFVTLRNTPDASASLTLDGHLNMLLCSDSSCWYVDKPRQQHLDRPEAGHTSRCAYAALVESLQGCDIQCPGRCGQKRGHRVSARRCVFGR